MERGTATSHGRQGKLSGVGGRSVAETRAGSADCETGSEKMALLVGRRPGLLACLSCLWVADSLPCSGCRERRTSKIRVEVYKISRPQVLLCVYSDHRARRSLRYQGPRKLSRCRSSPDASRIRHACASTKPGRGVLQPSDRTTRRTHRERGPVASGLGRSLVVNYFPRANHHHYPFIAKERAITTIQSTARERAITTIQSTARERAFTTIQSKAKERAINTIQSKARERTINTIRSLLRANYHLYPFMAREQAITTIQPTARVRTITTVQSTARERTIFNILLRACLSIVHGQHSCSQPKSERY
ncbi:hypothetical protein RRG08_054897 [Elysia crispata]|uniref:Uncharacterized protein n=1 Tax=Elysia crispata TaxID=231223 RepID=A0AAE1DTZ2_9GAST|nr:hypothetical protein RRG08_054897 [Elysia crispata]